MVNRIWQYHFGRGIVGRPTILGGWASASSRVLDFSPTIRSGFHINHPELILLSNTYRQSSAEPATAAGKALIAEKDPENKLLWRFTRERLDAEQLRDAMLAASGKLNPAVGGPSVMVPVSPELVAALYKPAQWQVTRDPKEHNRRSIYLISKRNLRLPLMESFDQTDALLRCARREAATHAPQALELLNGDFANQQAEAFAERLKAEAGPDPQRQVRWLTGWLRGCAEPEGNGSRGRVLEEPAVAAVLTGYVQHQCVSLYKLVRNTEALCRNTFPSLAAAGSSSRSRSAGSERTR
jgi:hypothetical protein